METVTIPNHPSTSCRNLARRRRSSTNGLVRLICHVKCLLVSLGMMWIMVGGLLRVQDNDSDKNKHTTRVTLRPENLKIVQQAPTVDVTFRSIKTYTSLARDEEGRPGYVHDARQLRNHPPPPLNSIPRHELWNQCAKRDATYQMLTQRVQVVVPEEDPPIRTRILCVVYTRPYHSHYVQAIRETWGPDCDGFFAASTETNRSLDMVDIPHEGEEDYDHIWQKVRSIWRYVYQYYYQEYDWFLLGQDDSFFILDNLRYYLTSPEIQTASMGGFDDKSQGNWQTPLFLGRRFAYMGNRNDVFNSAGPGYVLNKAAVKLLVTEGLPSMFQHDKSHFSDPMVSTLFREQFGVLPYDTKDDTGGERFMVSRLS